ncbi:hypothetical protein D6817_00390 [Candidatus Pacearchaeota archaeon]|nr:MAG: hypothetical protein D6817_00390 [Candidatus Pacearchaeota archaeon]
MNKKREIALLTLISILLLLTLALSAVYYFSFVFSKQPIGHVVFVKSPDQLENHQASAQGEKNSEARKTYPKV